MYGGTDPLDIQVHVGDWGLGEEGRNVTVLAAMSDNDAWVQHTFYLLQVARTTLGIIGQQIALDRSSETHRIA